MAFLRDSLRTFFVRFGLVFFNMIGGIINARWIGPEGVGIYALTGLIYLTAFRNGNLGFGASFAFFIARKEITTRQALRLSFAISIIMSALSCALFLATWQKPFSTWNDIPPVVFYVSLISILLFFINNFLERILSGHLNIKAINDSEIIRSVTYIVMLVVLVVLLELGVLGTVCAFIVSQMCVSAFRLFQAYKPVPTENPVQQEIRIGTLTRNMWRYGRWNYMILFLNFYLEQMPLIILKYFSPNNIIGFYTMGRNLMQKATMPAHAFSTALFPYTAASGDAEAVERTNRLCRNFFIISILMILCISLFIKPVIILLYGEAFLPSVTVFYAIAPAIIMFPFFHFLTVHLAGTGSPEKVFWLRLIMLPVCLAACFIFIPPFGAVGAALSLSATNIIMSALCLYVYVRHTGTSIAETFIPNKSDIELYKKFTQRMKSKLLSKQ